MNTIEWLQGLLNIKVQSNIINYTTTKTNRIKFIKQFKTSQTNQFLINVQILNEGIDIPECNSIFITKPNENTTNLVQRISRSNKIMPNKNICRIYLWNINKKILDTINNLCHLDNFYFNPTQTNNNILTNNNNSEQQQLTQSINTNNQINCLKKNFLKNILHLMN